MGTTPNYSLRKPTDPNAPADFITIVGALADDTDAALRAGLDSKSGAAHAHPADTDPIRADVVALQNETAALRNTDAGLRGDTDALLAFRALFRAGSVTIPVPADQATASKDLTFTSPYPVQSPRVVATVHGTAQWVASVSAVSPSGCRITIKHIDGVFRGTANVLVHFIAVAGLG